MKILKASYLLTFDDSFRVIRNGAVVFDKQILQVATLDAIGKKYPALEVIDLGPNSVLMPGLINAHVHLEYSANTTTLQYGSFPDWLDSVARHGKDLTRKATTALIAAQLDAMVRSGTTTLGAISSYSRDLPALLQSPLNKVFFCEALGNKAHTKAAALADLKTRLAAASQHHSANFHSGVAIHSPYSSHRSLTRAALALARAKNLAVTAHFLESAEEKHWLEHRQGSMLQLFSPRSRPKRSRALAFLQLFAGLENVSFTHCVAAGAEELAAIAALGATINHCPTSNRLLSNARLELERLQQIELAIGTDGLSSNTSLSMFDELRTALNIHYQQDARVLARTLLAAATVGGAKALGFASCKGRLVAGHDADITGFCLPAKLENTADIYLHAILHTRQVDIAVIGGEVVRWS